MMNYKNITLALMLLIFSACSETKSFETENNWEQQRPDFSGTYSRSGKNGAECTLKTDHNLLKGPFEEIDIELVCIRGAPSYNSGYALDTIRIVESIAVFSPDISNIDSDKCYIVFEFQEAEVKVTQIGLSGECGFGGSVYADGTYKLVDHAKPTLGCMRIDNPCNLDAPN